MNLKIFGREPALWIGLIYSALTTAATFVPQLGGFDARVQALLTAIATAALAWKVRPIAPAIFSGVIIAMADLAARFGLHMSDRQVSAIVAFVAVGVVLHTRSQGTPADDPAPGFVQGRVSLSKVGDDEP